VSVIAILAKTERWRFHLAFLAPVVLKRLTWGREASAVSL